MLILNRWKDIVKKNCAAQNINRKSSIKKVNGETGLYKNDERETARSHDERNGFKTWNINWLQRV